jgi:IclR family KDG regulon transcriptional repressor
MDSINKAFEILDLFLKTDKALSIKDIAGMTHISSGTVHRITRTLVNRGYLLQPEKRGAYSLSIVKLLDFTRIIKGRLQMRSIASPYLEDLSQTVNEAAVMAVLLGNVAYNIKLIRLDRLTNVIPDSTTLSLYTTGMGKIFLANMTERRLREYLGSIILKPRTPSTLTSVEALKKELKKVKENGFAFEDEEHEQGLRSIAAPVRDYDGVVVAAIAVLGPSTRLGWDRMQEVALTVRDTAAQISRALGYT